jgi:hypothetical protein
LIIERERDRDGVVDQELEKEMREREMGLWTMRLRK